MFSKLGLVIDRAILTAVIAVMNQAGRRVAVRHGAPQSLDGEVALQPVICCPADDAPRVEVEHDCKVEPALCRPDVGDVSTPFSVRLFGLEVLGDQVWRNWPGALAIRGSLEPPFLPCHEAVLAHQPCRAVTPDLMAFIDPVAMHPQTAIGAVRQGEHRANVGEIDHILSLSLSLSLSLAGRAVAPGEKSALADAQGPAYPVNGEACLLRLDEGEAHRLASFAKKAAAFLRCRAPASGTHSPGVADSVRHADRPMPRLAHRHPVHD